MIKIKPFDLIYRGERIRITKIKKEEKKIFRLILNEYTFDMIFYKGEKRSTYLKAVKLDALDLEELKIKIREYLLRVY